VKKFSLRNILWPIYFLSFFGVQYLSNWWTLRVSGIRGGSFIDLAAVLRWTDCFRAVGTSVYAPEDGKCGGYLYGNTLLRVLNLFGINATQTKFWGLFSGAVICISLGALAIFFTNKKGLNLILVGIILSSPGLWLLIERGNIDGLIFLLLLASSILIAKGFEVSAIFLIAITALFKFYTAPLLLVLVAISRTKRARATAVILFLTVLPIIVIDYLSIESDFPYTWFISFGAPSIGFWINLFDEKFGLELIHVGALVGHALGLMVLCFSAVLIRKISKNRMIHFAGSKLERTNKSWAESLFLVFGPVFVICYLFGMNYDYRLIFGAISGLAIISRNLEKNISFIIKVSLLLGLWLSSFSFGIQNDTSQVTVIPFIVIQFIGDIALGIFFVFLSLELFQTLKEKNQFVQTESHS
jgi:hypothetical protein